MEQVSHPSFEMPPLVMQLNIEPCWMDPYIEYLKTVKLSKDRLEARKIATKVANYPVLRGTLYKREKSTLQLRCRTGGGVSYNKRSASSHMWGSRGSIILANNIFQQGYFQPMVKKEAEEFVKKCDIYQQFGNGINILKMLQLSISNPQRFS